MHCGIEIQGRHTHKRPFHFASSFKVHAFIGACDHQDSGHSGALHALWNCQVQPWFSPDCSSSGDILSYITLHYLALPCITLHCITLHCITLHTYIHTYIPTYIRTYIRTYEHPRICILYLMFLYLSPSLSLSLSRYTYTYIYTSHVQIHVCI